MQVETLGHACGDSLSPTSLDDAQLVLAFGSRASLDSVVQNLWRQRWPGSHILGCTTAGEILGTHVNDDTASVVAIRFDATTVQLASVEILGLDDRDVGRRLGTALTHNRLRHVLVLADGLHVNGTSLLAGLRAALPAGTTVSGGMAGDGERFEHTYVVADDGPRSHCVAAVGLYGDRLRVGYGSLGGWDPFGPLRLITRSEGNILFELDGESALALYKRYLGPHAERLPASGLRFPLALHATVDARDYLVRTILSVDESTQSMSFAGDLPVGQYVQLMRANLERLLEGAKQAAVRSTWGLSSEARLALLVSCVGRRLIMGQRVEEELEEVSAILGGNCLMSGFYSYGEFSPNWGNAKCELHNQTMTITVLDEV